jgi:hypothetical protein
MSLRAIELSNEKSVALSAPSGLSGLGIVFALSVVLGPLAWLACRVISDRFVGNGQGWILVAFCVIGFELAWLAYGAALLVRKGFAAPREALKQQTQTSAGAMLLAQLKLKAPAVIHKYVTTAIPIHLK